MHFDPSLRTSRLSCPWFYLVVRPYDQHLMSVLLRYQLLTACLPRAQVLEREMAWLRRSMEQQFEAQQAALLAKMAALEAKLAAGSAAGAGSK
jgi:hypothetical protein